MHVLTVGRTNSGKSNLNKRIALDLCTENNVAVFDPIGSSGWPDSAAKFSSEKKLFDYLEHAQNTYVFIDEAKRLWDFDERKADALVYQKRHQGILIFLIAQRAKMVRPNARNQCAKIFAFKQARTDADEIQDEFGIDSDLIQKLKPGEFCAGDGFVTEMGQLDYARGIPPQIVIDSHG